MNTRIQDAHNLAWKLARRTGMGAPTRPCWTPTAASSAGRVAQSKTPKQSMTNSMKHAETSVSDQSLIHNTTIETEARPAAARHRSLPRHPSEPGRAALLSGSAGQVFGMVYDSTAVVDDGSSVEHSTRPTYVAECSSWRHCVAA